MRGSDDQQAKLFYNLSYDRVLPDEHPLRHIRRVVDQVLTELDALFREMYSDTGRPSIAPERLLRALLLEVLYSIRSDRQLVERLNYDLLAKWFVGLDLDETPWDASTFSRNRDRLMTFQVAREFFHRVLQEANRRRLLSQKHFTVDGTLLQSWASLKSVRPKDEEDPPSTGGGRNAESNFHGEKRTNETHTSTTDPEARLCRKGDSQPAVLGFLGHVMTENRHGLVISGEVTEASGVAEREAALRMAAQLTQGSTLGADKAYDVAATVAQLRQMGVTPHFARYAHHRRRSTIDGRTTRHPGYQISQRRRKIVEEVFGWLKTVGGFRKVRWIGRAAIEWRYLLALAAYNLVRMTNLSRRPMTSA